MLNPVRGDRPVRFPSDLLYDNASSDESRRGQQVKTCSRLREARNISGQRLSTILRHFLFCRYRLAFANKTNYRFTHRRYRQSELSAYNLSCSRVHEGGLTFHLFVAAVTRSWQYGCDLLPSADTSEPSSDSTPRRMGG